MLSLALSLPVPAAMAQPVGEGGGEPATAVTIAGTPATHGEGGAHTSHPVTGYNHAGGTNDALAVIVSGRPQSGGAQAITVTWNGVAVPERVDTSDIAGLTANESFVWVGLLVGAASGVQALAVGFDKTQSDSDRATRLAGERRPGGAGGRLASTSMKRKRRQWRRPAGPGRARQISSSPGPGSRSAPRSRP
ncbi:MAG: hypothetical protein R3D28_16785 [Geminicoccaceae bacterium]